MFPFFIFLGKEVSLYSILTLCGIFTAGINGCIMAKKKYEYVDFIILSLFLFLGVIIGSSLLYAIVNIFKIIIVFQNLHLIKTINDLSYVLFVIFGGGVFYGGLLGALLTFYIFQKSKPIYFQFIDIFAVNVPLFHFFGRIGCFLSGCCFGIPCKIGFIYKLNPFLEANNIRRFPVQLLEAFFNLIIFIVLYYLYKKELFMNKLLYIYLTIYAIGRFFIEFLRGDTYRGIWLGLLSTSQIISIIIIIYLLCYYFIIRRKSKPIQTAVRGGLVS